MLTHYCTERTRKTSMHTMHSSRRRLPEDSDLGRNLGRRRLVMRWRMHMSALVRRDHHPWILRQPLDPFLDPAILLCASVVAPWMLGVLHDLLAILPPLVCGEVTLHTSTRETWRSSPSLRVASSPFRSSASFLHRRMESTGATFFFARSAFPPTAVTAVKDARLLLASGGRWRRPSVLPVVAAALDKGPGASGNGGKKTGGGGVPNSNYVVPLDLTPSFIRPLKEILRDLNKRVPDNIINAADNSVPWYHANRMLSFYAPGWCGEVRAIEFSDNHVTVVYRVTVRGLDGEIHRESTATVSLNDGRFEDPLAAAEELAFCKACARFGFGLHLYHEETPKNI